MKKSYFVKAVSILKIPVFFVFFAYLMVSALYNIGGLDYQFHIKAGEYIVSHNAIPDSDVFSFTAQGKSWLDHEWLYQVLIFCMYHYGGIDALFILKIIVFSLAFFLLSVYLYRMNWIYSLPILLLFLSLAKTRFTLRPDTISFLFFIAFLMPMIFKKRKLLYGLPFIQLIWVNVHGFFFLGPLVMLLYAIFGERKKSHSDRTFYKTTLLMGLLVGLVCFATPWPFKMVRYPFEILTMLFQPEASVLSQHIGELGGALTNSFLQLQFVTLFILTMVSLILGRSNKLFWTVTTAIVAAFSLYAIRNLYFFIPVAAAVIGSQYSFCSAFFKKYFVKDKTLAFIRVSFLIFCIATAFDLYAKTLNAPDQGFTQLEEDNTVAFRSKYYSLDSLRRPARLVSFIKNVKLPPRMFNSFNLGAPLIFSTYPERKVFIDGRTELYGNEFYLLYRNVLKGNDAAINRVLDEYAVSGFIFSYSADAPPPCIRNLYKRGFECVYFGGDGIVFVSSDVFSENPHLASYRVDFSSYEVPALDMIANIRLMQPKPVSLFQKGYVLYLVGERDSAAEYFRQVLRLDPQHSLALFFLADSEYKKGNLDEAFSLARQSFFLDSSQEGIVALLSKLYYVSGLPDAAMDLLEHHGLDIDEFIEEVSNE